jgi:hypothetical protein
VCTSSEDKKMSTLGTPSTALADLVRRFQVCWEVWPEYVVISQKSRQVGFELELLGSHKSLGEFDSSCPKSVEIHVALESIARWILQRDEVVTFEIQDCGQRLCYSSARGNRPDVALLIKILHRTSFESPVDECERAYLEKAKARLRQLGACEHQWHFATSNNGKELAAA